MLKIISTLMVLTSLMTIPKLVLAKELIRYPQAGEIYDRHHVYPLSLLRLALSYSDQDFEIIPSQYFMPQGRAIKQLNKDLDIDVLWTMTSIERETLIQPIRIPIYKGLIGWRLFLTTSKNPNLVDGGVAPNRLHYLKMIQGHDWPDTDTLKFNGFNVHTGTDYLGLFKILALGRADLFPRSIIEIWDEIEEHGNDDIVLEKDSVISYPTATYFFVAPNNKRLATLIEIGLNKAIEDGSFSRLFNKHYKPMIDKANLKDRVHHRLMNPILPDETPLKDKYLWFQIERD